MASAVRTLLKKKKLTGEELGRILLVDLANTEAGKPNLSQEEIANLHTYIDNPRDGKIFNDYTDIQRYIIAFQMDFQIESRRLAVIYLQLFHYWNNLKDAEQAYSALNRQPRILTRRDYEKYLKETRAMIEGFSYSFIQLAIQEAETYAPKFKEGEATPYDDAFKELQGQSIPLHMVDIYQALYKSDSDLKKYDKLDYLKNWIYVYDPMETDDKKSPLELVKDYPNFVEAITNRFSQLEGLEHLANMNEADYIREDLIDFKTAYKLNLIDAKDMYDKPLLIANGVSLENGVAIIEATASNLEANIKDGTYYYQMPHGLYRKLSESMVKDEDLINDIAKTHSQLKQTLKRMHGFSYGLDKFIEITGVKELSVFNFSKRRVTVEVITDMFMDIEYLIQRFGLLEDERPVEELREEVKALLIPDFTDEDLAIQPHEAEKVEEIIANASSKGEAVRLVGNYVTGLEA